MKEILIDLLLKIYIYYPIGIPHLQSDYPGYELLQKKITTKIDNITNGVNTPWNTFILETQKNLDYKVVDYSYLQFPSYLAKIELLKTIDSEKESMSEIIVCVSLLADYYTIYIRDYYTFFKYFGKSKSDEQPTFETLYYNSNSEKTYFNLCESLKAKIENAFPNYSFVKHSLLFNVEVEGGIIYGHGLDNGVSHNYSLYEYLFDNNINKQNTVILD